MVRDMLHKLLLAAGVAAFSSNALAADLPSVAPAVYVPPPALTWAGIYIGATAGFAEGFHTFDDLNGAFIGYPGLADTRSSGFAGGGTLGVNLQAGSLVYGIETDINWLSNKTTYLDPNVVNNFQPYDATRLNYLGTARGRLGLAVDRTLIYFTAGVAYANVNNNLSNFSASGFPTFELPGFNVSSTRVGWVVGAGVEYGFAANWTIKGEALYADLGRANSTFVVPPPGTGPGTRLAAGLIYGARFDTSVAIIRAGLNYKFDLFAPTGAAVARY
jgi:outer membrane immunogenic protein